jgi:hypothetical protein
VIITHKHVNRRTVLRGCGAALALPLLDCMVPALTALRKTAARPACRLGVVYVPNGMMMKNWTPSAEGADFELTPTLTPLEPFRRRLLVLSGLRDQHAFPKPGEGVGDHARAAATFLTGVHVKRTEGADLRAGVSMDQVAAQVLANETQLASLELALESAELVGACDGGYSCAYTNTIAWRTPTTPLPMENNPRAVFERLFGDSGATDPALRRARLQEDRSVLDAVTGELARFKAGLGPRDLNKVSEYADAIRDIERRLQRAEVQSDRDLPLVEQPPGIPPTYEEHARLMFELLSLAYQIDLTRVSTFMMAREVSARGYPEVGVPDAHHAVSHHENNQEKLVKLAKINAFHMTLFARFLEKLQTTADGDGSLLDHSMILYGTAISDSNQHLHDDLPVLLVGGGAGQLQGGRHLRFPKETPVTNLYLSLLDKMGAAVEAIGDSSGRIDLLSGV